MHDKPTSRIKRPHIRESIETRYFEERDSLFRGLQSLDRRTFMKVSTGAAAAAGRGLRKPPLPQLSCRSTSLPPQKVAARARASRSPTSPTRTCHKEDQRALHPALLRAVDDVQRHGPAAGFRALRR